MSWRYTLCIISRRYRIVDQDPETRQNLQLSTSNQKIIDYIS